MNGGNDNRFFGGGVPDRVHPGGPIPMFSLTGRLIGPEESIRVGCVQLSGDCKWSGYTVTIPWLMVLAVLAVFLSFMDLIWKYNDAIHRSTYDYFWLGGVALCNFAPLWAPRLLLDTRTNIHGSLKPLIASRVLRYGVKVVVDGVEDDEIVMALKIFLKLTGHLHESHLNEEEKAKLNARPKFNRGGTLTKAPIQPFETYVTVHVMKSLEHRDRLFAQDPDGEFVVYVWSGEGDPFTKDEIGQRLMRYLVLVASWEKENLAEDLFSAIGVRVAAILHKGD